MRFGRLLLAALLAVALAAQTARAARLLRVERMLRAVEVRTELVLYGRAPAAVLQANLRALDEAERLQRDDVRILLARGANLLLLGRVAAAVAVYERALRLQERPELHLNLGRALHLLGRREEAKEHFARAVLLDPFNMPRELPPSVRLTDLPPVR